jgi:phosphatidylglycerol:prolipoprotein diacylglycerol transferase
MYGFLVSLGILASLLVANHIVKKDGKDPKVLWDASFYTIIGGVVGARIYHVINFFSYYSQNPINIFKIWNGGLGIIGAIIGGAAALYIYLKVNREQTSYWLDVAAIVTPLGQAIGRWGNFFNKEIYPYCVYESVLDFALFLLMFYVYKNLGKNKKHGFFFYLYIIGYSLVRFGLEFTKRNAWEIAGLLNVAQFISILALVTAVIKIGLINKDDLHRK